MKKLETLKKSHDGKIKFTNKYFGYHKDKEIENSIINIISIHTEQSCEEFKKDIRKRYPKVACGRNTKLFWTQIGYTEEESKKLIKPYRVKKDPSTSPMNIQFWIKRGYTEEESSFKIKSQRKLNKEYWEIRGYTEEESILKVTEYQKENVRKFIKKKENNPDYFSSVNTNQVKYWINKGYTEEESILKVKERQTTFSKKICIEKYGELEGIRVWEKRQEKWIDSLILSNYNLSDGKSVPMKERIVKYDIDKLVDSLNISNKELFKNLLKSCDTIEKFIIGYSDHFNEKNLDEISLYNIIKPINKLIILHEFYKTNKNHIMSLLMPKITRVKSLYGNLSWFNGHICRSDGEYIISNWLFKNNIKYEYEKYYNNSKKRCDFYLIDYDIYIEYMGLEAKRYKTKLDFLNMNNINHISSNDVSDLKLKIMEYVNNTNK